MTVVEPVRLDAPKEDLVRMSSVRFDQTGDGNTLVGYAAVFNEPTVINSWEGNFVEQIAPGAFRKTLQERGNQIRVLLNHGMDPTVGDKPLGKPSKMIEDARGFYVEVPLSDTSYNQDIKALLRDGALDGMSFRMTVINEKWSNLDNPDGSLPERTITELRCYEFGPVTFPAYAATQAGVRAHAPAAYEAWRAANLPAPVAVVIDGHVVAESTTEVVERDEPEIASDPESDPEAEPTDVTRSTNDEAATTDTPSPYIPAQRAPLTTEQRQAHRAEVAAYATEQRNP